VAGVSRHSTAAAGEVRLLLLPLLQLLLLLLVMLTGSSAFLVSADCTSA
jgi:hypothetical protein